MNRERELLVRNGTMLNSQNEQLLNITRTLESTHDTAQTTSSKLKDQETKIMIIHHTNKDVQKETRRADRTMRTMQNRQFCRKAVLYIIAILLGISIVIIIAVKLS